MSTVLWLKTSGEGKREEATLNRVAGFLHTAREGAEFSKSSTPRVH